MIFLCIVKIVYIQNYLSDPSKKYKCCLWFHESLINKIINLNFLKINLFISCLILIVL